MAINTWQWKHSTYICCQNSTGDRDWWQGSVYQGDTDWWQGDKVVFINWKDQVAPIIALLFGSDVFLRWHIRNYLSSSSYYRSKQSIREISIYKLNFPKYFNLKWVHDEKKIMWPPYIWKVAYCSLTNEVL
jgi:hypothetical protein